MRRGFLFMLMTGLSISSLAQGGFLRGKVIDAETGEGLFGATISKRGTTKGTSADFDGNYSLTLEPGLHSIEFRFFSYQTKTVSDVEIRAGEVTQLDISLVAATTELDEVVITAEQARDTEAALMVVQKKSTNLIDGISAQFFKRLGDGDLGVAMKRVTGVSVQGGKHVYVRGLGDRYTKTSINGMSIPGLDPDKNAVQIDIFPTSTIENVIVYKTFSPDLEGDFTGGTVDVETKKFPEDKTTSLSLSLGYNPDMHLKSGYLSYDGSGLDFLGFGKSGRALPFNKKDLIPSHITQPRAAESYTRSFDNRLAARHSTNFIDYALSFAHGNQVNTEKAAIGYHAIVNYSKQTRLYDRAIFNNEYFKENEADNFALDPALKKTGSMAAADVMWSALLSGALKYDRHSYSLSVMRSQNGTSSASTRFTSDLFENPSTTIDNVLTYTQRSVTNAILTGAHAFNHFDVEWKAALAFSVISDPDMRDSRIEEEEDGSFGLNTGVGAGINRYYRNLNEINRSVKADLTYPAGENSQLKFGVLGTFKKRNYEILEYIFRNIGSGEITDNPDFLLQPEQIFTAAKNAGTVVKGNFQPANTYDAAQYLFASYLLNEQSITGKLKAVYGLRVEKTNMDYTGANQRGETFNGFETLNETNFLPSANLVYSVSDAMNLRASANRTLARPTFKEKSFAQIYDPISGRTFIGNINLNQTTINNYDLRWEYFYGRGEMLSLSAFYKSFDGHIELVSFPTGPDQLTPRNSGQSTVMGFEIEFKKNISDHLSFGTNASFIKSAVDMHSVLVDGVKTEYRLRTENLRDGELLHNDRSMAGQSPYLINAYVNYTNSSGSFNAGLAYNVQGETLNIVGSGAVPDVYTKPFNSLNLNVYRNLGEDQRGRVTFGVDNILGAKRENFHKSFGGDDPAFSLFEPGRTFSLKYSYSF